MKSGFIAILGKPNVGKSSLMNALVGQKVSIVSPRAQTTRDRIMGIVTEPDYQMIFLDTPGVHAATTQLGVYMDKCVRTASEDVDAIVIVLDATKQVSEDEIKFIEKHLRRDTHVYVVINKTDLVSYEKIYPMLSRLAHLTVAEDGRGVIKEIIPTSCRSGYNIDILKKYLEGELLEGECYFPDDEITDKSERYMICEILREKALLFLQDEVPHGIGVYIQSMVYENGLANIEVDIICEKESHKAIIIGKDGEKLKTIGERARLDIEKLLDCKVYLKIFVKVRENWRNKRSVLSDIGYDDKKNI